MKKLLLPIFAMALLYACSNEKKEEKPAATDSTAAATPAPEKKAPTEILDLSVADEIKNSFAAFAKGDLDGMTAVFADDVRYTWSGGDSAIGKKAVRDYYAGRLKLIDSINYSEEIVLPLQVNEPQSKAVFPGKWVLFWAHTNVKYKNGKKISFWMHNTNHYNAAGKVDFVGQYIDRAPIMAATKGMAVK